MFVCIYNGSDADTMHFGMQQYFPDAGKRTGHCRGCNRHVNEICAQDTMQATGTTAQFTSRSHEEERGEYWLDVDNRIVEASPRAPIPRHAILP